MATFSTIGALGSQAMHTGAMYGTLHLIDQPFYESLGRVNKSLAITAIEMNKHFQQTNATLGAITRSSMAIAGIVSVGIVGAVSVFRDYEKELYNINTIAKMSTSSLNAMSREVKNISRELGAFSPQQLAQGLYQIYSSGFAGADAMKVLNVSARTAMAGLADFRTSATAVVGILQAYGKGANEANYVSDILFQTVNLGIITMEELTQGIGNVSAAASAAGIPLEEVGAAIATITRAGYMPAEALTRVERFITSITTKPTPEMKQFLKDLGFASGQDMFNKIGFSGVIDTLAKQVGTKDLNLLGKLFGDRREIQGAISLMRQGGQAFQDMYKGMQDSVGATSAAVREQQKSLSYTLNQIQQAFVTSFIDLGQKYKERIKDFAGGLIGLADWVGKLNANVITGVVKWAAYAAVISKVYSTILSIREGYRGMASTYLEKYQDQQTRVFGLTTGVTTHEQVAAKKELITLQIQATAEEKKALQLAIERVNVEQRVLDIQMKTVVASDKAAVTRVKNASLAVVEAEANYKASQKSLTIANAHAKTAVSAIGMNTLEKKALVELTQQEVANAEAVRLEALTKLNATKVTQEKTVATYGARAALVEETIATNQNTVAQKEQLTTMQQEKIARLAEIDDYVRLRLEIYNQITARVTQLQTQIKEIVVNDTESASRKKLMQVELEDVLVKQDLAAKNLQLAATGVAGRTAMTGLGGSIKNFASILGLSWQTLAFFAAMAAMVFVLDKVGKAMSGVNEQTEKQIELMDKEVQGLDKQISQRRELQSRMNTLLDEYESLNGVTKDANKAQERQVEIATAIRKVMIDAKMPVNQLTAAFKGQGDQLGINIGKLRGYMNELLNANDLMNQAALKGARLDVMKARENLGKLYRSFNWGANQPDQSTIEEQRRLLQVFLGPKGQTGSTGREVMWLQNFINEYKNANITTTITPEGLLTYLQTRIGSIPSWGLDEGQKKVLNLLQHTYSGSAAFTWFTEAVDKERLSQVKNAINSLPADKRNSLNQVQGDLNAAELFYQGVAATQGLVKPEGTTLPSTSGGGLYTPSATGNIITDTINSVKAKIDKSIRDGTTEDLFNVLIDAAKIQLEKLKDTKGIKQEDIDSIDTAIFDLVKTKAEQTIRFIGVDKKLEDADAQIAASELLVAQAQGTKDLKDDIAAQTGVTIATTAKQVIIQELIAAFDTILSTIKNKNSEVYLMYSEERNNLQKALDDGKLKGVQLINTSNDLQQKYNEYLEQTITDKINNLNESYRTGENPGEVIQGLRGIVDNNILTDEQKRSIFEKINTIIMAEADYIADSAKSFDSVFNVIQFLLKSSELTLPNIQKLQDVLIGSMKDWIDKIIDDVESGTDTIEGGRNKLTNISNLVSTIPGFDKNPIFEGFSKVDTFEGKGDTKVLDGLRRSLDSLNDKYKVGTFLLKDYIAALSNFIKINKNVIGAESIVSDAQIKVNDALENQTAALEKAKEAQQSYLDAVHEQELLKYGYSIEDQVKKGTITQTEAQRLLLLQKLSVNDELITSLEAEQILNGSNVEINTKIVKAMTERITLLHDINNLTEKNIQQNSVLAEIISATQSGDVFNLAKLRTKGYQEFKVKVNMKDAEGKNILDEKGNPKTEMVPWEQWFNNEYLAKLFKNNPKMMGQIKGVGMIAGGVQGITSYQGTNQLEGGLSGFMGGLGIAEGLSTLFPALISGPVGLAIGLLGGIFGASQAQKNANRIAQQIREQQLKELKKINNSLKPVSDYFNRGGFGSLTPNMSFNGGLSLDLQRGVRI